MYDKCVNTGGDKDSAAKILLGVARCTKNGERKWKFLIVVSNSEKLCFKEIIHNVFSFITLISNRTLITLGPMI